MTITNYKLKEFLQEGLEKIEDYLPFLELLQPTAEITHPKTQMMIKVRDVRELTFGRVNELRINLQVPSLEALFESITFVTNLTEEEVMELTILDYYGTLASIKKGLEIISLMEENELGDDEDDDADETEILYRSVNASQRMARFGVMNTINCLAGGDITKFKAIEDLPFMVVFTKLVMNKTNEKINREVELLRKNKLRQ
ncbi:MAG: hypothetical protein DI539_09435 [Flavobacterium psychrophilum]|nr:MAG: hypothetical protein DI539_09435 [Flavobacterium psychrophilum]